MGLHFSHRKMSDEARTWNHSEPQGHESLPLKHFGPQSSFSPVLCLKSPSRAKNVVTHLFFVCQLGVT